MRPAARALEPPTTRARTGSGRPPATTHAELTQIGIQLFTENGYDETSVDDIAAAAGIARRTFFGYYPSKADVVWGDFDAEVDRMSDHLAGMPADVGLMEAVRRAVVAFNAVPPEAEAQHRRRLGLILGVPTLVAHSTLRYAQWRRAVAMFAAHRLGQEPDDLVPSAVGHCALGTAVAASETWRAAPRTDLGTLLDQAFGELAAGFGDG